VPDDPQTWAEAIQQFIGHSEKGDGLLDRCPRCPRPGESGPVYWPLDALTGDDRAFNVELMLRYSEALLKEAQRREEFGEQTPDAVGCRE
jgi:hypothetical protein